MINKKRKAGGWPLRRERLVDGHWEEKGCMVDDHSEKKGWWNMNGLYLLLLCSLSNKKVSFSCHNWDELDLSISNVSLIIAFTIRKGFLKQFYCKIKDTILLQTPTWLNLQNVNKGIPVRNFVKESILFASPVVEISHNKN